MPVLRVVIVAEVDGVPVPGFPYIRRMSLDEGQGFDYEKVSGGGYVTIPADQLDTIQALLLKPDRAVTVRLDNQTDRGIRLAAGGILAIVDFTADQGAGANNAKIDNSGAAAAQIKGYAGGT